MQTVKRRLDRAWLEGDGSGYPRALTGDAILVEARILAVADAYEAMLADCAYRSAMAPDEARAELTRCAGSQFDQRVVDAFLQLLHNGLADAGSASERAAA
jgi:HD-GYP domain-containing protein (c-di-GMP phosphodiesterase class II)